MTVKGDEVKSNFIYHTQSIENTVQYYNTNLKQGLTQEEAAIRLKKYGKNVIAGGPKVSAIKILLGHIFTFMNIVLVAAMVLSFVVQEWIDGAVLVFILFINVVIGFIQDYRSEKTMEALQKMTQPQCRVVRDGQVVQIASTDIVPGDIVHIKQGDSIPADLRLFSSVHMECDEALLTGESLPVEKSIDVIDKADAPLGDRHNMAFMNSTVQKGKGKGIVVASGMKTQLGKIAKSLNKAGKKQSTRLELGMKILGIVLVIAAIVCLGLTLFGAGVHKSMPVFPDAFKSGITTAIAIVPEVCTLSYLLSHLLGPYPHYYAHHGSRYKKHGKAKGYCEKNERFGSTW
jgi:magnesium-transporting ATPase (P-type)